MADQPTTPLSMKMALDALKDQCAALAEAEERVTRERGIRDDLIRDARYMGVSYRMLIHVTGLSRQTLSNLTLRPNSGHYQGALASEDPEYQMMDLKPIRKVDRKPRKDSPKNNYPRFE